MPAGTVIGCEERGMRQKRMRVMAVLSGAVTVAAVTLGAALAAAPASASTTPALPSQDPFYTYSGSLSGVAPGTVLRTRTVSIAENGSPTPISATQVLYRTTGQLGQPTVTVATVIRPTLTVGATKIVSYQTAYDALGSECDPSYTLQGGNSSYSTAQDEEQFILGYVSAGYTVVVSDYEGEDLEWAAGQESGYDTLDAVRATEKLLGLSASSTPVGMVGYSGGSIATDFASELAPTYAPELDIVGVAIGGVPVDYLHNLTYINGSSDWAGVIPAVLVSLSRAYRLSFAPYLSSYGTQVTGQVGDQCINNFASDYPGLTIQKLLQPRFQDYEKIHDLVAISDHMIMSDTGTPKGPMFVGVGDSDGTGDTIMITNDDEALAHTYCERGVSVQFNVYSGEDHTDAAVPFEGGAFSFLTARLNGLPVTDGCASIGAGNSLAPQPIPPALTLSVVSPKRCTRTRGVEFKVASAFGPQDDVVFTLSRGNKVISTRTLTQLTMAKRQLILDKGHVAAAGLYALQVTQGGLTLLDRTVNVHAQRSCRAAPRPPARAPSFTG